MGELVNKVTIITSKRMLEKLRITMREIEISEIKAAMVQGSTLSSDIKSKEETEFLQKVRIEMLVSDEQLSTLVDTMRNIFYSETENDM